MVGSVYDQAKSRPALQTVHVSLLALPRVVELMNGPQPISKLAARRRISKGVNDPPCITLAVLPEDSVKRINPFVSIGIDHLARRGYPERILSDNSALGKAEFMNDLSLW
uniref:Uncharacterized protein n=1 Tax=Globodera rostochiensis TaxID=31243 RepID=A0A914IGD2_GLORO